MTPDQSEIALVVFQGANTIVQLCDPESLEVRETISEKPGRQFVNYTPDGKRLLVTHEKQGLIVWDCQDRGIKVENQDFPKAWEVFFEPDGESILIGEGWGELTRWSLKTGESLGKALDHGDFPVEAAAVKSDGSLALTGGADMRACFWEPEGDSWKQVDEVEFGGRIKWIEFSPKGEGLVLAGARDGKVRVWESATRQPLCEIVASEMTLTLAHFTPDGDHVLTVSMDGFARIWDARTGLPVTSPMRHDEWWAVPEPKVDDAEWLEDVFSQIGQRID